MAGALLAAGPASAASRGFTLHNNGSHPLRLESATHVPRVLCIADRCVPTYYPIDFEGRPANGAVLKSGAPPQHWELKYGFSLILTEIQYAAKLTYKIEGTDGTVEYVIATTPTANDSECKVIPAHLARCSAAGLKLTFSNP
jgi:hypothetical protein